jgi:2-haloacid dehalogenase
MPFYDVTLASLKHAVAEHSIVLTDSEIQRLMRGYNSLSTFPDVPPGLQSLALSSSITPVVFSNGTHSMISSSIKKSLSLSPHASVFQNLISVDNVGCYKPSPGAYRHLISSLELDQSSALNNSIQFNSELQSELN